MQAPNIMRLIEGSKFKPVKIQQRGTMTECVVYEYVLYANGNKRSLEKVFIFSGLKHECQAKVQQLVKANPYYLHVN